MLAERERVMAAYPEVTAAVDMGPLMGAHEREYWVWCMERYARKCYEIGHPYIDRKTGERLSR
jgi:hypothetical protein